MLIKRFIPFASALVIFVSLEALFYRASLLYWLTAILAGFLAIFVFWLIGKGVSSYKQRFIFLLTPILFLLSGILFIIFLEGAWAKQFVAVVIAGLIWLFLENIFVYLYAPQKYLEHSLRNASMYTNLLAIFFFFAGFSALQVFLTLPIWLLMAAALLVTIMLVYQTFWVNKILFARSRPYILVISLIVMEIFWVATLLPVSFLIKGIIVAIAYYIMAGLSCPYLLGNMPGYLVKRYLAVGSLMLLLALLTARWI